MEIPDFRVPDCSSEIPPQLPPRNSPDNDAAFDADIIVTEEKSSVRPTSFSSFTSLFSTTQNSKIDTAALAERTKSMASSFATSAFTFATNMKKGIEEASKDLDRTKTEFLKTASNFTESRSPVIVASIESFPWTGLSNESELKKQILALSSDKRNFVINPSEDADFEFDLSSSYQAAM
ncbi:hypothetical protein HK096_008264, partial [Nowakowskiella sp. JEL0078]